MRFSEQEKTTIRDLINRGDRIPAYRVMDELRRHFNKASKLDKAGEHGPEFLRHLILAGFLMNRAIFELHLVPQHVTARI